MPRNSLTDRVLAPALMLLLAALWAPPSARAAPALEARAGYAVVHDPQFEHHSMATLGAHLRRGPARLSPAAYLALNADTQLLSLEGACRLLGPRGLWLPRSPHHLEARAAGAYHRFGDAGFEVFTWELSLAGRLVVGLPWPQLDAAFAELALGWSTQYYSYPAVAAEAFGAVALRLGVGLRLGRGGEVTLYYDHAHHGLVGGLSVDRGWDGVPGHVGLAGRYYFWRRWGVGLDLALGSAYIAGLSLLFRAGGAR